MLLVDFVLISGKDYHQACQQDRPCARGRYQFVLAETIYLFLMSFSIVSRDHVLA